MDKTNKQGGKTENSSRYGENGCLHGGYPDLTLLQRVIEILKKSLALEWDIRTCIYGLVPVMVVLSEVHLAVRHRPCHANPFSHCRLRR
jgi:hypothetical protein